jgi:predicted cation transporter
MTGLTATPVLLLLLLGPVAVDRIERNLEAWFFILGVIAATLAHAWSLELIIGVARAPAFITIAVIAAGIIFGQFRPMLDHRFGVLRQKLSRPTLTAISIIVIGLLSSLITAIVGALLLIEAIGMLGLGPPSRNRVAVAGCFAIGLGSALTPAGGPFSAIVASGLGLRFLTLIRLLGLWLVPGVVVAGLLAAWFARGDYDLIAEEMSMREGTGDALRQGLKVFAFVAGLALVSAAYAPLAARWIPQLGGTALFWGNTVSAALDNAALAAIEAHGLAGARLRPALLSMIISGGMLIPGNIPNIICASALGIRSAEWGRIGIPLGLVMLGICFALSYFTS